MAINKVLVCPRHIIKHDIGKYVPKDFAIISIINDSKDILLTSAFVKENQIVDIPQMTVWFNDMTELEYHAMRRSAKEFVRLFTVMEARLIFEFVESVNKNPAVNTLIVHCEAGQSRSGAVGLWANRYLKLEEHLFRRHNPQVHPNPWVLKTLTDYSGMTNDYLIWWKDLE